jgi:hypothetical protein
MNNYVIIRKQLLPRVPGGLFAALLCPASAMLGGQDTSDGKLPVPQGAPCSLGPAQPAVRIEVLQSNARQTRGADRGPPEQLQQDSRAVSQHLQETSTLKRQLDQSADILLESEKNQLRQQLLDLQYKVLLEESKESMDAFRGDCLTDSKRTMDAFRSRYEQQLEDVRGHYDKQIEALQKGSALVQSIAKEKQIEKEIEVLQKGSALVLDNLKHDGSFVCPSCAVLLQWPGMRAQYHHAAEDLQAYCSSLGGRSKRRRIAAFLDRD